MGVEKSNREFAAILVAQWNDDNGSAVGLRPMAVCDVSAGKCILSKKQFVPEKCSACLYGSAHWYAFGVRHVGNENQLSVWKTG